MAVDRMTAPPPEPTLDDIARERIKAWLKATGTTQTEVCDRIGKTQGWMSRYLAAEFNTDLETLKAIAGIFRHPITALFDVPSDPDDALLLDVFHAMPPDGRQLYLQLGQHMTAGRKTGGRGGRKK